ncbi:MAG: hypothetical protein QOJ53_201 [Sphingomonadales bacterium]|jgi:hypothetical protein|nr:hypothetical protein [Sphingomonadales bacterium]MEA3045869.1 hypothetical protein [Sphingomonadales bacterium]
MDGQPIAARPLGHAGLGTLSTGFPGARALEIRLDAALSILAETAAERAAVHAPEQPGPSGTMRATRP